jgi:hypothetical protein
MWQPFLVRSRVGKYNYVLRAKKIGHGAKKLICLKNVLISKCNMQIGFKMGR